MALAVVALAAVLILDGQGGADDGIGGIAMALAVLFLAALFLNRLFRKRITAGFDEDGVYSPTQGWVPWSHVRRLEVRRMGNVVTGRRTVIWLAYQPSADDLLEAAFSGDDDFELAAAGGDGAAPAAGDSLTAVADGAPGDHHPSGSPPSGSPPSGSPPSGSPAGDDPASAGPAMRWMRITPSLNEARTLRLSELMERHWSAHRRPPPLQPAPRTPPPAD